MHFLDHLRLGKIQHFVVEPEILGVTGELAPAIVRFSELARLNHRAHGAVEQQNALPHQLGQFGANLFTTIHRFRITP